MKKEEKLILGMSKEQLREFAKLNFQKGQQQAQENSQTYVKGYKDGKKEAHAEEVEWLKRHLKFIRNARKNVAGLQPYQYPIEKRIKTLEEKGK